jgi:hypothetical protein
MNQASATATISTTTLQKWSVGGLLSMEADLRKEAAAARTDEAYEPIRKQIHRVRAVRVNKQYAAAQR